MKQTADQFGEWEHGWGFVSPGHGDVNFEELFRALNRIGYQGPLSIEWDVQDALAFVRQTDFAPSAIAFEAWGKRERASTMETGD